MIIDIKRLIVRRRVEIMYLLAGLLTTLVNFVVYIFLAKVCGMVYWIANSIAWILAVLVAYITNRIWVFRSTNTHYIREVIAFLSSRLYSGALEMGLMVLFVDWLMFDDVLSKVLVASIVIVTNYLMSRYLVFRQNGEHI